MRPRRQRKAVQRITIVGARKPVIPLEDAVFEPGDDIRLKGAFVCLAWLALAISTFVLPNNAVTAYFGTAPATITFAVVGIVFCAVTVAPIPQPLLKRAQRSAVWLLGLGLLIEIIELGTAANNLSSG